MTSTQRMRQRLKERLASLPVRMEARNGMRQVRAKRNRILAALHRGRLDTPDEAVAWFNENGVPYRKQEIFGALLLITPERTLFYSPNGAISRHKRGGYNGITVPEPGSLFPEGDSGTAPGGVSLQP